MKTDEKFIIMRCSVFITACVCAGILIICAHGYSEEVHPDTPVNIGSRLELFVDSALIGTLNGVELRLQTPIKLPLPKSPLKGDYMTVIKEGDIYRAYYRAKDQDYKGPLGGDGNPGEITCYAESEDGHEWTFPDLGLYEVAGSRHNNVILAKSPPFSHSFSPFLDTRPGINEKERYKALAGARADVYERATGQPGGGLYAFVSPDGIHWHKKDTEPVIPYRKTSPAGETRFDSQHGVFWSEAEQLYVCYFRTMETPHGQLRTISRTTSPDFTNWSVPIAMAPNLPGEQLYTNQTFPYFRNPHIYIALPTRFYERGGTQGGTTDIMFMTSRAGSTAYDRLFTEAFIRPGIDPDRWANRSNYVATNVVPTGPAEMSIYHSSGNRYSLRIDGFVSARAGATEGELLTKPLIFSGRELVINYSTSAGGAIQVEIQEEDGTPFSGFNLQDCLEITGDEIERTISWKGAPDLEKLAGRSVRIRFVMKECDLYSFRFQ